VLLELEVHAELLSALETLEHDRLLRFGLGWLRQDPETQGIVKVGQRTFF
jgi:hypothetical protein